MALTPEQRAELERLKQMYLPLVEAQRLKDLNQAKREQAGLPVILPTDRKADGGYVSVLGRDMSNPEYRAKLENEQALENVYPEAYLAPLARSAMSAAKAMFTPQARQVVSNPIGWKIRVPSKENLGEYTMPPPAVFVPRTQKEIAKHSFKELPEKLLGTAIDSAPRVVASGANDLLNWSRGNQDKQSKAKGGQISQDAMQLALMKKGGGLEKFLSESKIKERLYHITPHDIKQFKPGGNDPKKSGPAIWLTPEREHLPAAHNISYRDEQGKTYPISGPNAKFRAGTNVMPVHVHTKNPLTLDDPTMLEWAQKVFAGGSREFPQVVLPDWANEIQKEGYDSIHYADPHGLGHAHEVIMFEPNKIKSAIGNRGTYNMKHKDITKAHGGITHAHHLEVEERPL